MHARSCYATLVAMVIAAAAHADTPLSPEDNVKMEAALSLCTKEIRRSLGRASYPERTIEDIERAITNPTTEVEARKRMQFFASCFGKNFLGQYCIDHPYASQCEVFRSP